MSLLNKTQKNSIKSGGFSKMNSLQKRYSQKKVSSINLSKGVCTRAEKNSYHTVYSITEMTLVAMLTKPWDKSDPPIIKVEDK